MFPVTITFFVVSITFFADNMKKTEFLEFITRGEVGWGEGRKRLLTPKVHMLLSSNLFEMLSAPNLLSSL